MPMAVTKPGGKRSREASGGTLGDILYSKNALSSPSEQDWITLVQSIAAGDQGALYTLYARTHRIVFTLIMRLTSNRETAEELTLDVFHDVWRRAPSYDPKNGSVVGWILNQARSRAIDRVRLEHRKKRINPHPEDEGVLGSVPSGYDAIELQEQQRRLREALAVLTPAERLTIETAYFSELTHAEVAAVLKEPVGTIKTRIRSGLRKLRDALVGQSKP